MRSSIKISISSLLKFQIYFVLVIEGIISLVHIPGFFRYISDVNFLFVFIVYLSQRRKAKYDLITTNLFRYIILYILGLLTYAFIRLVPIGQIVWAFRNNFFYILFGLLCVVYFDKNDVDEIFGTIVKFQVLNFLCGLLEFFVFHYRDDYLGGMFGTAQGCNGLLNTYLVVICTYTISKYVLKQSTIIELLWILFSSLVMAALAELKFFYIELFLIVLFVLLMSKQSNKKIMIGIGTLIALFFGMQILSVVSPDSMQLFMDRENMLEYLTRSDFGNDDVRIARFTAIAQINKTFFGDNVAFRLFGFGFGACEDSETFSFFNSAFANNYSYLGYRNLSVSMLYLETGIIGLALFIYLFIRIIYIGNVVKNAQLSRYSNHYVIFVQVLCLMSIVGIWYNSAIRRPIAYLTFFCLSVLFILLKDSEIESFD